jgi:hypothetical protein
MSLRGTLSLDLDDAWAYVRAAGRGDWAATATVVPLACARIGELMAELGQELTVFVVGCDLEDETRRAAVAGLLAAGHEVGCHSYGHRPDFAALSEAELRAEVEGGVAAIERHLGRRPAGFRAPGYARHPGARRVLREFGFAYDGSSLPTWLGPVCRAYYFCQSGMSRAERRRRAAMYGGLSDALAPNRPRFRLDGPPLLEIPVTTCPVLRAPMHMSYLIWLARRSRRLAIAYLRAGLAACRLLRVEPSFLLHSLDFVGRGEHPDLAFFPGMDVDWADKRRLLTEVVGRLQDGFGLMPMGRYAAERAAAIVSRGA